MALWDDVKQPSVFGGAKPKYALNKVQQPSSAMQTLLNAGKAGSTANKTAIAGAGPNKPAFRWPAGELALEQRNPYTAPAPNGGTRQGVDDIPESTYRDGPPPPSILEELFARMTRGYEGTDESSVDFSALDKALQTRLGMLDQARGTIQGNFDTSDRNIQGMHDAFQNQVRTEDAARYNQISDQQKGNLNANAQQGVGALEGARAKAVAERQEMLQRLGIQAAGAAPDTSNEAYDQGISNINQRNTTSQNLAENQRGTNLAYNNTVAQSIGQAGVARRSALQQQLQGLLGKVAMAESETRAQNEQQRQAALGQANEQGYKQWADQRDFTKDIWTQLSDQELAREKMGMAPEAKPTGLNAIAYDLENTGVDPAMAQRGLQALSQILTEGNYLEGANGTTGNTPYDRVNVITQKLKGAGVDPMTATQIGIAYGNL